MIGHVVVRNQNKQYKMSQKDLRQNKIVQSKQSKPNILKHTKKENKKLVL